MRTLMDIVEGAAPKSFSVPNTLYHATLKDHVESITEHGLQPTNGTLANDSTNPLMVFAADEKGRQKLLAVLAYHVAKKLRKQFYDVTGNDLMRDGAIAIITDTTAFRKALRRGVPYKVLEPRDYYATDVIQVSSFLIGDELRQFLRDQWRRLPESFIEPAISVLGPTAPYR